MKKYLAAALLVSAGPIFAADVGVSVSIGQPSFYGQINVGNQYPRPVLVYSQPVIIEQARVVQQPLYLHVPPGHAKHWRQHCGQYGACGAPVYFVQDNWYNRVYVPEYRQREGHRDHDSHDGWNNRGGQEHGRDHDNGHGHGHRD